MHRKYFFFDIDGTLMAGKAGQQYCPESTMRTLKHLQEQGHFVAIATGRSEAMAVEVMRSFNIHNMVHDGGQGITIDDNLIDIEPLDYDKCIALIDECEEKGIPWGFNPDNSKIRTTPDDRFWECTHDPYMETQVIPGVNPRDYDKIYKVYVACPPEVDDTLEALKELPWARYNNEFFFVEPIDKSIGIYRILEIFDGKESDVVVFGDSKNDLSMFLPQWTSIAMGNASDDLKEKATYVTTDVDKDGIYLACKHFGWID